jgi:hypothetical protein
MHRRVNRTLAAALVLLASICAPARDSGPLATPVCRPFMRIFNLSSHHEYAQMEAAATEYLASFGDEYTAYEQLGLSCYAQGKDHLAIAALQRALSAPHKCKELALPGRQGQWAIHLYLAAIYKPSDPERSTQELALAKRDLEREVRRRISDADLNSIAKAGSDHLAELRSHATPK